jgi:hypothetical protein
MRYFVIKTDSDAVETATVLALRIVLTNRPLKKKKHYVASKRREVITR